MRPKMKLNLPKLDAQQNVFLARTLEHVDPTEFRVLFAGLLGQVYIPPIEGVPREADSYNYSMIEFTGDSASPVGTPGRGANDSIIVGVKRTEVKCPIVEIPVSFEWTMREIEQATKYNVPLDQWTIQAAMSYVKRKIDDMLAFGRAGSAIKGLLNNSAVNSSTATTKTGGQIEWTASTPPDEMLADINKIVSELRAALKQASDSPDGAGLPAFDKFTVLMPSAEFALAATTPRSSNSDTTVLRYAIDNNPWIESIEEWRQCNADAGYATNGKLQFQRMVAFPRNPMCLGALTPDDWTQRAPQEEGHKIVVPAVGLCGGTVIRYPVACRYMNLAD